MIIYSFKYLGRLLSAFYGDCPVVVYNIRKARKKWAQPLSWVLGWEGVGARTAGMF